MLRFIILISVVVCGALAETCDLAAYRQCLRAGKDKSNEASASPRPRRQWFEKPQFKCLKDAQCQLTTPRPKGELKSKTAEFERFMKCIETALNPVKNDIQTCVQKQFPSFKFPEQENDQGKRHFHKRHHKNFFDHLVNETCPTDAAKASALACIKALPHKENNRTSKFCAKKATCKASLSAVCEQQFVQIKQQICTCATSVINAQKNQIDSALKSCTPPFTPKPGKEPKENVEERLIKRFCPKKDRCQKTN